MVLQVSSADRAREVCQTVDVPCQTIGVTFQAIFLGPLLPLQGLSPFTQSLIIIIRKIP